MGGLLASVVLMTAAPVADELVLGPDNVVEVTINGKPARLRIDTGVGVIPILNPEAVARLGLRPGAGDATALVGSTRLPGHSASVSFGLPGAPKPKAALAVWFSAAFADGADGAVHPFFLHQTRVRIPLPGKGGRETALPLRDTGFHNREVVIEKAGERIEIGFPLWRAEAMATADAGRLLALAHDGVLAAGRSGTQALAFGVVRPWRELKLRTPLEIGPFRLAVIRVRMPDSGSAGIAEEGADPDEILVTRTNRKPNRSLGIGRDQLDRCAWLETDRRAKTIRFDCPG